MNFKKPEAHSGQKGYALRGSVTQNEAAGEARSVLDDLARQGAQRMLEEALEVEVQEFVARHEHVVDAEGRRRVVRTGRPANRTVDSTS